MLKNVLAKKEKAIKNDSVVSKPKAVKSNIKLNKYEKIIAEAVQKQLLDESDKDMKMIELQALSDEEFNDYVKEVHASENISVTNISADKVKKEEVKMTAAVKALFELRQSGSAIGDFSNSESISTIDSSFSGSRSLASVKQERSLDVDNDFFDNQGNDKSMDMLVESLSNSITKPVKTASVEKKPMSNLHGLTKPIVQTSKPFKSSLNDLFNEVNWTIGGRK